MAEQTTERSLGPYPSEEAERFWTQYLDRFLGTGDQAGLLDNLEQAQQERESAFEDYTNALASSEQDVLGAIDTARQNPVNVSIGGGEFSLAPRGGINLAQQAHQVRSQSPQRRYQFETQHPSVQPELNYLEQLKSPAMQMQGWRYGMPTTTQNTNLGTMGQVGGWTNIASTGLQGLNTLNNMTGGSLGDAGWSLLDSAGSAMGY